MLEEGGEGSQEFEREKIRSTFIFADLVCCGPQHVHVVVHRPGQNRSANPRAAVDCPRGV